MRYNGFRIVVFCGIFVFLAILPSSTAEVYSQAGPSAKYIILMVADGWGEKQIEATNKYTGNTPSYQQSGAGWSKHWISTFPSGGSYNSTQAWSNFTYVLQNPTDSAAAATALYTGLKTQNARITASPDGASRFVSIGEKAKTVGKSVGAVSSVPLSHATPGAWTSHNRDRSNGYAIADEALFGNPNTTGQPSDPFYAGGLGPTLPSVDVLIGDRRTNYVNDTIRNTLVSDGVYEVVEGVAGQDGGANLLAAANDSNVTKLAGLFDHVFHNADGSGFDSETPTLADSTEAALAVLSRDPNGFVLMVEGGAVDWAGHSNNMNQMIGEMKDFNEAVQAVIDWVNDPTNDATWDNTLVIVTGDHETGYLTQAPGVFPDQSLGQVNAATVALEKSYTGSNGRRASWVDTDNDGVIDAGETVHWAWNSSGHSNSLIPLYARGAGAELFPGHATSNDPVRGAYLDNTDVMTIMLLSMLQQQSILEGAIWRYVVQTGPGPDRWNHIGFDDSQWLRGASGFGFGQARYNTRVDALRDTGAKIFVRRSFVVNDPNRVTRIMLSVVSDGPFVAYMNGIEIFRSTAKVNETIDITGFAHELFPGQNILAVETHISDVQNDSFSFIPLLEIVEG